MKFDYYFSPISYICALKWSSEANGEEEADIVGESSENPHLAKDVRLQFKQKIVEKCLKIGSTYAAFNKITCLLFYQDVFKL